MTIDNLGNYFEKIALQNKKQIAVQFLNGDKISFGNLNLNSNKISNWMIKSGVKSNNCICILSNKNEKPIFKKPIYISSSKENVNVNGSYRRNWL